MFPLKKAAIVTTSTQDHPLVVTTCYMQQRRRLFCDCACQQRDRKTRRRSVTAVPCFRFLAAFSVAIRNDSAHTHTQITRRGTHQTGLVTMTVRKHVSEPTETQVRRGSDHHLLQVRLLSSGKEKFRVVRFGRLLGIGLLEAIHAQYL